MTDDELNDALHALGRTPVEPPGDEFADRLELRLRAEHSTRGDGADPAVRRTAARAMALAAVVVLVVGLALTVGPGRQSDDGRLLLASAEGTHLVLPDGTVVVARPGMELAEGTLVVTSTAGSARADGVEVPADRVAVVERGRLRLLRVDDPPATTSPPTTRPDDGGTSTSAPPTTSSPPTSPATSTTRPPATTSTAPPRPPVAAIDLTAERRDRRLVALRWSAYSRGDFARYLLVRTVSGADGRPSDPGPSSTTVLSTADRTIRGFSDELPVGAVRAAYRIIVLDHRHQVVGTSVVARV